MGSILTCVPTDLIDTDFTNKMTAAISETIVSIPLAYKLERERIIGEMRRASPQPYQGLLFNDYPTTNSAEVNALARRNVTSDQVKQQIANQVTILLQPEINVKLAGLNPCAHWVASKVIEIAIETAVNQAVDLIDLSDNNVPTTTPLASNNIRTTTPLANNNIPTTTPPNNNNIPTITSPNNNNTLTPTISNNSNKLTTTTSINNNIIKTTTFNNSKTPTTTT